MTGEDRLNFLLTAIRSRAGAEKDAVTAKAEDECNAIQSRTDKLIEKMKAEAAREVEISVDYETNRISGLAKLEENRKLLIVKHELIKHAFEQARLKIEELNGSDTYFISLEKRMIEAVEAMGESISDVVVASGDLKFCETVFEKRKILTDLCSSAGSPGTVTAKSVDGQRVLDNSLDTRFKNAVRTMKYDVAEILFKTGESSEEAE